jgi:hypothetical protein
MTSEDVARPPISDNSAADDAPRQGEIVAKAGTYYRVARYVIFAVMLGMGLWFGYDGFRGYPEHNKKVDELEARRTTALNRGDKDEETRILAEMNEIGKRKSDKDIFFQKLLFFTLPPLAIALIVRWLWISRGAYRLTADNVLHVPGHPPVPVDSITEIDRRLWDRKGIVLISYELADGQKGTLKLDDFIYQREPTDEIFKRIEDQVAPPAQDQTRDQQAQSQRAPQEEVRN